MKTTTHPLLVPYSLLASSTAAFDSGGTSINQFLVTAVAEKLAALKTADFFAKRRDRADIEAATRLLRRTGGQSPAPDDVL